MEINQLPGMNMDKSETNCCPKFDVQGWDSQEIVFKDKLFAKTYTKSFFHIPLNMKKVMEHACGILEKENAFDKFFMLSHDPSLWKAEHYISVTKKVSELEMAALSGTFLTKVFEGDYKEMRKWIKQTEEFVKSKSKEMKKLFFFYTTCPKCAKHFGKNYVVAFAQV